MATAANLKCEICENEKYMNYKPCKKPTRYSSSAGHAISYAITCCH